MDVSTGQFHRAELLLGADNIKKLKNRRVAVFGVGGVGGHLAEALCRNAIGAIDIIDGDVVDITNINRQIIATYKTIGLSKVDVMRDRLLDINPELKINTFNLFYLPETANEIDLSVYDYIADAIDTITAKIELICRAKKAGVPVISSMGAANKLDPTSFCITDIYKTSVCPMARIMRRELKKRGIDSLKVVYSTEKPLNRNHDLDNDQIDNFNNFRPLPGSVSFVPAVAGLILASEVIKDLISSK